MIHLVNHQDFLKNPLAYTLLDASSSQTYAQTHLLNARHIAPELLVESGDVVKGGLPAWPDLVERLQCLGIRPEESLLVYDDEGGGWAGRLAWTLHYAGFEHISYLNGGLLSWISAGHPVTAEPTILPAPSILNVQKNKGVLADLEDVLSALGDPNVVIVDTRPADHYYGRRITALKNGHIPGAVHFQSTDCIDREHSPQLKPKAVLEALFQEKGITPDKTIICYCHRFHSAALVYLALQTLGYPSVKGYPGSWSEWGNHPDTPVDKEA